MNNLEAMIFVKGVAITLLSILCAIYSCDSQTWLVVNPSLMTAAVITAIIGPCLIFLPLFTSYGRNPR